MSSTEAKAADGSGIGGAASNGADFRPSRPRQQQKEQQQQQQQPLLDSVRFRTVRPTDIPACHALEKASYPDDEAASKSTLQYRQHHAARFFRCAVLKGGGGGGGGVDFSAGGGPGGSGSNSGGSAVVVADTDDDDRQSESDVVAGYVCSTRCHDFESADAMAVHLPDGPLLAIHSVVVSGRFRRRGVATAMLRNYVDAVRRMNAQHRASVVAAASARREAGGCGAAGGGGGGGGGAGAGSSSTGTGDGGPLEVPIRKIVLLAKAELLAFYCRCGFQVVRPSPIVHGRELWYECQIDLEAESAVDSKVGGVPCHIVDAFVDADSGATGNPAAVVLLRRREQSDPQEHQAAAEGGSNNGSDVEEEEEDDEDSISAAGDGGDLPTAKLSSVAPPGAEGPIDAAGCISNIDDDALRRWMQRVAKEFNLSETAFVVPRNDDFLSSPNSGTTGDGGGGGSKSGSSEESLSDDADGGGGGGKKKTKELHYDIRYYSPTVEVPLCGHATVASAAVLYQTADLPFRNTKRTDTSLVFHARNDTLRAQLGKQTLIASDSGSKTRTTRIMVQFPIKPVEEVTDPVEKSMVIQMIQSALAVDVEAVLFVGISQGLGDLLVEVTLESFLSIGYEGLNYDAFLEYDGYKRGVIVCCRGSDVPDSKTAEKQQRENSETSSSAVSLGGPETNFLSRFFAPKAGIREDPVTGSAHCALAPFFCEMLDKDKVVGKQMSSRGGVIVCRLMGDKKDEVRLTGNAVTAMSGTFWL